MEITLATPALLFPAITLLLLAYTNRFLALASLIRNLHVKYLDSPDELIIRQIGALKHRVLLIRNMQVFGTLSLLLCVVAMFAIFSGSQWAGQMVFGISLLLMMVSLALSVWEIQISVRALNLQLGDIRKGRKKA